MSGRNLFSEYPNSVEYTLSKLVNSYQDQGNLTAAKTYLQQLDSIIKSQAQYAVFKLECEKKNHLSGLKLFQEISKKTCQEKTSFVWK